MRKDHLHTVIEHNKSKDPKENEKSDPFQSFLIVDYVYPMSWTPSSKEDRNVTPTIFHKYRQIYRIGPNGYLDF